MTTKKFLDGIAFYKNDKEIAFYSNITEQITYNIPSNCINCAAISFNDNLFIINMVKIYRMTIKNKWYTIDKYFLLWYIKTN